MNLLIIPICYAVLFAWGTYVGYYEECKMYEGSSKWIDNHHDLITMLLCVLAFIAILIFINIDMPYDSEDHKPSGTFYNINEGFEWISLLGFAAYPFKKLGVKCGEKLAFNKLKNEIRKKRRK